MEEKKLFIIDSSAFLYKNYYALPNFTTSKGEEVGALFGFIRLLFKIKKLSNYIVACYDSPKSFRKEIYLEYKSNRQKPDDALILQIKKSMEVASLLGIKCLQVNGYEADDIIATIAKKFSNNFEIIIVGADKDLMQIVSNNVKIWDGKSDEFFGPDYVKNKYGVEPKNMCDFLSLVGDSSDNVPGVDGIGPKTAARLIEKYGSIKNIFESLDNDKLVRKIKDAKEKIENSLNLIKLRDDIDINISENDFFISEFKKEGILELAKRFEFREALKMIEDNNLDDLSKYKEVDSNDEFVDKDYISVDENYICFENIYSPVKEKDFIKKIVTNENTHKYFYNAKYMMYFFETSDFKNFDDIYLLYHLVNGGARKPDIERIIYEYFSITPKIKPIYYKKIADDLKSKINELSMSELYKNELDLSSVLYEMEKTGIRVDVFKMNKILKDFDEEISKITQNFKNLTNTDINLNSPKQISDYLFKKLNLKIDDKFTSLYKMKTQKYSTTKDLLNILYPYAPEIISLILKHREYSKLKSFVENLIESVKGERIHTTYDQASTATGRLASSNPNLQNIPVRTIQGRKIRRCFIADEGCFLVSFDYSQIDLRVLAHMSGDEKLISSFINGEDIHIRTAKSIFGVENVSDEERRIAKTINFGIIYGQTPLGLSIEAGIDVDAAKKYIDDYFNYYKGVAKWIDETIRFATINKYVENFMKRRRILNDIVSPNRALREASKRIAINMPVQSGSSDIIKKAMISIYKEYRNNSDIKLILQIHDELVFSIKKEKINDYIPDIKYLMENSFTLRVPLVVDIKYGTTLEDMSKWG